MLTQRQLFLVVNDDGINAPGIKSLHKAVEKFGDVYVVAPAQEQSAQSHAITISEPLRIREIEPHVFAVEGTPADCVLLGMRKILPRKPDWVISGINHGGNLGQDTLYSGTVGAAMEGALNGALAMAISLHGKGEWHFETAEVVLEKLLEKIHLLEIGAKKVLNVNIPNILSENLNGFAFAEPGVKIYDDFIHEKLDPRGRPYYWIGGDFGAYEQISGSDCHLVANGYVTLSVLKACLYDNTATEHLAQKAGLAFSKDAF